MSIFIQYSATCLALLLFIAPHVDAAVSLELYGNFHSMGVICTLDANEDSNRNATASLSYRTGDATYSDGFPLSRIENNLFLGSIFWLEPGTSYDVRVTFYDPDGAPLNGLTMEGTMATRTEIPISPVTTSYYVSPGGSGSLCSQSEPCAFSQALSQVQAGEEIVLYGGIYYEGGFNIPRSGTSEAPIVIRGAEGEEAVFDGSDPEDFSWTHQGDGVYRTSINTSNPNLVMARDERLFPYQNLTNLEGLSRGGTPGSYSSGTSLYVHLAGDANPNGIDMAVSRHNVAFTLSNRNHIQFKNLTFRNYGQGSYPKAMFLNGSSNNLIQNCLFANNALAIGIKYESSQNLIEECEVYSSTFTFPFSDVKAVGSLEGGGVVMFSPMTGRGNVLRRNTVHDGFDGLSTCPGTTAISSETDVYENTIYNMGSDAISVDGRAVNVRIWKNTIHDVLTGISVAPALGGPSYVIRNLVYRTGAGNNNYSGMPVKFNVGGYDPSGPIFIFHNTADAVLPGNNGLSIKEPGGWELIYSRNNIWSGTNYAIYNYNTSYPVDFDYDNVYTSTTVSGRFIYWEEGANWRKPDLQTFRNDTGQELHGLNEIPGFVNALNGEYGLASSSELVDKGILIHGINDKYTGLAPDIGAFETEDEYSLADVIKTLQVLAGFGNTTGVRDALYNNGKIELAEAIYILQIVADLR